MQPPGEHKRHHHHGLTPNDIYDALCSIRNPKDVYASYDDRYVIVTLATIFENSNVYIAIIVTPNASLKNDFAANVIKIITMYPIKK